MSELTNINTPTKLFVDMDGVIADFSKGVKTKIMPEFQEGVTEGNRKLDNKMWRGISLYQKNGHHFWFELEPMPDAFDLWNYVKKYNPQILTAAGNPQFNAGEQKRRWITKYFGADVIVHVVQKSVEKAQYAIPGAILIDDKHKALDPWIAAGGTGVLHTSAANSIAQLKQLGL